MTAKQKLRRLQEIKIAEAQSHRSNERACNSQSLLSTLLLDFHASVCSQLLFIWRSLCRLNLPDQLVAFATTVAVVIEVLGLLGYCREQWELLILLPKFFRHTLSLDSKWLIKGESLVLNHISTRVILVDKITIKWHGNKIFFYFSCLIQNL